MDMDGFVTRGFGLFWGGCGFCGLRQRLQSCGGWGLWVAGCARLLWVFWAISCNSSEAQSPKNGNLRSSSGGTFAA